MPSTIQGPVVTLTAGEDLDQYDVVKVEASTAQVVKTEGTSGDDVLLAGVVQDYDPDDGDGVAVWLASAGGVVLCRAAKAITKGSRVYTAADGEVTDATTSGTSIGIALDTASAADEVIRVLIDRYED